MRIAQRLFAGSALVITLLVVLVLALSGERLRRELEATEIEQLGREAHFVAEQWTSAAASGTLASRAGAALGHRVTLIDSTGRVIGDSEFRGEALLHLQNHAGRPEVIAARRSGFGFSRRQSPSKGDEELYVAVPARFGVARISMSNTQLDTIIGYVWRDVLISALIALAVALVASLIFARRLSRPIVELRDVARAIAAGDLERRPALASTGEIGELGTAMHRMAAQLASRLRALERDETLLAAVIESLHEGVVAVDAHRQVVRVNASGRHLLRLRDATPFPMDHLPRDGALRHMLGEALAGGAGKPVEIVVDGRSLALTARPLADGGAVLAVLDLTDARRVDAMRRDFVANVSHELKTPLTVIGGFAETLATEELPAPLLAQFAESIRTNAERMRRIIDDLLDLSRIESGGWQPNPARVDVRAVAEEVIAAVARTERSDGVTITTDVDPGAPCIWADPTAMRQVIANLVDNAVRHTPAGGQVTVFTRSDTDGVWLGVRDTGVGIAPEHLPRIFERFYRADSARARAGGGTGLGLSIVRHLVEAHGGRVMAESELGRGTTVSAWFPAADVTSP